MKRILLFITLFSSLFFMSVGVVFAVLTWSETQPGGNNTFSWAASAISTNGLKIIVGNQDGGLYLSSNGGSTWAQINPSPYDSSVWYTAAMSGDGQVILVGTYGNRMYLSTNGGNSWSETQPKGDSDANWVTTSMSSDGQTMLAGVESGRLYLSTNGGASWSETQPAGNVNATSYTAISSNGQILLVGEDEGSGGRVYLSTNRGASWSETQPIGDADYGWRTVSMSPDGQVMLVGTGGGGGRLYLSTNGGSSWSETQPIGDEEADWILSSISSNGQTMLVSRGQRLYLSTNGGTSWAETQPMGNQNGNWQLLNISGNSEFMVAGNYDGRLYLGLNPPPPSTGGNPSSSAQCATPNGPPDLFQINTNTNSATLYFAPVGQATNYVISYGFSSPANQFAVMTGLGASTGALSYTVNSLPQNATIYFKVYGQNDCGQGNWSNTMQVTTNGRTYFKNLLSQVTSILPRQTTVLGAKTQKKVLGQKVACTSYTVKSGDSLWSIASNLLGSGAAYSSIVSSNNLSSTNLSVGQKLKVGC